MRSPAGQARRSQGYRVEKRLLLALCTCVLSAFIHEQLGLIVPLLFDGASGVRRNKAHQQRAREVKPVLWHDAWHSTRHRRPRNPGAASSSRLFVTAILRLVGDEGLEPPTYRV
jgi:hypothetical protein